MRKSKSIKINKHNTTLKIILIIAVMPLMALATIFAFENMDIVIDDGHSYVPKNGFVPDQEMAVKIAELIARKIYGDARIDRQKPFHTSLRGDIWIISGTMPAHLVGGTFQVHISRIDGRIIRVTHGK